MTIMKSKSFKNEKETALMHSNKILFWGKIDLRQHGIII